MERSALQPFEAFAKGVVLWREELLSYFEEPTTNGYAEGVINKVKVIKRKAYGLPPSTASESGFSSSMRMNGITLASPAGSA